ncbi:hypothetical protein RI543_004521 [Arxiozyma heterogenica]|uniref:Ras modification protein ERF4 n=1 Tax=Arxiozyma heterogenica TaxID=278026 RepID=A0AAN7WMD3_9SACH|nr:hypothetical protein RI543_004521 [Kazachstania heterogenica]
MEEHSANDNITFETPGTTSSIIKTVSNGCDLELNGENKWNIQLPSIISNQQNEKNINHTLFGISGQDECMKNQNNNSTSNNNNNNNNILFFNYHEFQETYYFEVDSLEEGPKEHDTGHSIVITHFPNIYVSPDSTEWRKTRIVRIPRSYDQRVTYPCFSEYLPGHEPAAIIVSDKNARDKFICQGKSPRDGQWYGYGSISPLSIYFTQDKFQEIIKKINSLIEEDFQLGGWINIFDLVMEYFTFGLFNFSKIINCQLRNQGTKVDQYITELNSTDEFIRHGIQIIPLARSAYLSLDFQIPSPTPT